MLNKTYSLRPHCVSCWTTYILQDDTRFLQCQDKFLLSLTGFEARILVTTQTTLSWTNNNNDYNNDFIMILLTHEPNGVLLGQH